MNTNFSDSENPKYMKELKYGNLLLYFPTLINLLVWGYIVYYFYYPHLYKNNPGLKTGFLILLPLLLVPFYIYFNFKSMIGEKALYFPGWSPCLETDKAQGDIIGTWDMKCGTSQIIYTTEIATRLQNRFYYIAYAIFLIVLIHLKITKNKIKGDHIIYVMIPLIFSTLGVLPNMFSMSYAWSFIIINMYVGLLAITVVSSLILLFSLYNSK